MRVLLLAVGCLIVTACGAERASFSEALVNESDDDSPAVDRKPTDTGDDDDDYDIPVDEPDDGSVAHATDAGVDTWQPPVVVPDPQGVDAGPDTDAGMEIEPRTPIPSCLPGSTKY